MEESAERGVAFVTLYARILRELDNNPRMAQETLARRLNVTMRTAQRHLTELERERYVSVNRDRKPYVYEIAWDRSIPHFDKYSVDLFRGDKQLSPTKR